MPQSDIRVLVPRVRRAVEGVGSPAVLSNDAIKDLVADAISDILLYTGSIFGNALIVTDTDEATGAPSEYATSEEMTLAEASVVAAQAALNHYFFQFSGVKTSERIADEAGSWEWSTSASLLKARLDMLIRARDKALEALEGSVAGLDIYQSYLAVRDLATSRYIEPWVESSGVGGLLTDGGLVLEPDFRFGGYG